MSLKTDIQKFLVENQENAFTLAKNFQKAHDLVLYGESHVRIVKKARFFARLINAGHVQYHASEYFFNSENFGDMIEKYLKGEITKSGLSSQARPSIAILDAIKRDLTTRSVVFGGTYTTSGLTNRRHKAIYDSFKSSYNLHIKAGRFAKTNKGQFHIGAFHASRLPQSGSTKTTAQRLMADGFDCGIVRILVKGKSNMGVGHPAWFGEGDSVTPVIGRGGIFELVPFCVRLQGETLLGQIYK